MQFINKKNVKWITFKIFANLNFAIFLLFLVLLFSMLGSIIEQHQSLAYYQNLYPINTSYLLNFNWKLIISLGLDNIYESWWFIFILAILACSLIICTFSVQLPSLRNARRWKFIYSDNTNRQPIVLAKNKDFFKISMVNIAYCLNNQGYYCFSRHNKVYAYKGLIGRIAPIVVHISLIIILLGGVVGFTGGFIVQEMVPVGEIFHIKNILSSGFKNIAPTYSTFRVRNFYLDYNFDNSVKQFFSELSYINENGKQIFYPTIAVNSPLRYKGMTFYQTDWQINSLRIQIDLDCVIQYKLNKVQIGKSVFWMCRLPIESNKYVFIIISGMNDKISIYNSSGEFISAISLNQKINIDQTFFRIIEIMSSTGLQIKVDPGLSLVYLGFALLIISTFISYISYSQLWFSINDESCYLHGCTNRAILSFEEELTSIYNKYIKYCI